MLTWWISRNKPPNLILTQSLHLKYACGKRAVPYSASLYTVFHSVNYNSVGFAFCPNTVEDRIRIRNTAMLVLLSGSGLKGPAPNRFCIRNTLHVRNGLTDRYPNSLQWKISIWLSTLTASFEIHNLVWETEGGGFLFHSWPQNPQSGPLKMAGNHNGFQPEGKPELGGRLNGLCEEISWKWELQKYKGK